MPFHLQEATTQDVQLIAEMAERIWRVHYVPIIGQAQVDYMLRKGYSATALEQSMRSGELMFLCFADKKPIGYLSVTKRGDAEYFLNKFYIEVDQQGKGAGKNLFALLVAEFPEMQLLRLQVNRLNYKTINFYFRIGFTIELAKDFDIGEGYSMDDYVMAWRKG